MQSTVYPQTMDNKNQSVTVNTKTAPYIYILLYIYIARQLKTEDKWKMWCIYVSRISNKIVYHVCNHPIILSLITTNTHDIRTSTYVCTTYHAMLRHGSTARHITIKKTKQMEINDTPLACFKIRLCERHTVAWYYYSLQLQIQLQSQITKERAEEDGGLRTST
jgi:hypothetical protein